MWSVRCGERLQPGWRAHGSARLPGALVVLLLLLNPLLLLEMEPLDRRRASIPLDLPCLRHERRRRSSAGLKEILQAGLIGFVLSKEGGRRAKSTGNRRPLREVDFRDRGEREPTAAADGQARLPESVAPCFARREHLLFGVRRLVLRGARPVAERDENLRRVAVADVKTRLHISGKLGTAGPLWGPVKKGETSNRGLQGV